MLGGPFIIRRRHTSEGIRHDQLADTAHVLPVKTAQFLGHVFLLDYGGSYVWT